MVQLLIKSWLAPFSSLENNLINLCLLRDGSGYHDGWIFGKLPKGGGSFSIQKFMLHILDFYVRLFLEVFRKNIATWFSANEVGSKAVWNFSENSSVLVAWPVPKKCKIATFDEAGKYLLMQTGKILKGKQVDLTLQLYDPWPIRKFIGGRAKKIQIWY